MFIRNAFVKKEHILTFFFDLEKAYDTFWQTSGILVSGAISPGLFSTSCLNVLSRLEWVPLCWSCMSRRWGSRKVASCLQPCLEEYRLLLFVDNFVCEQKDIKQSRELCSCVLTAFKTGCLRTALSSPPPRQSASTFTSGTFFFSQTLTSFWKKNAYKSSQTSKIPWSYI